MSDDGLRPYSTYTLSTCDLRLPSYSALITRFNTFFPHYEKDLALIIDITKSKMRAQ